MTLESVEAMWSCSCCRDTQHQGNVSHQAFQSDGDSCTWAFTAPQTVSSQRRERGSDGLQRSGNLQSTEGICVRSMVSPFWKRVSRRVSKSFDQAQHSLGRLAVRLLTSLFSAIHSARYHSGGISSASLRTTCSCICSIRESQGSNDFQPLTLSYTSFLASLLVEDYPERSILLH
jgi:hypothetical protein